MQWPGSQCATKEGCCLKKTPKPARDFIITGFQPYYFNGTWPENCDPASHLDVSKVSFFYSSAVLKTVVYKFVRVDSSGSWVGIRRLRKEGHTSMIL